LPTHATNTDLGLNGKLFCICEDGKLKDNVDLIPNRLGQGRYQLLKQSKTTTVWRRDILTCRKRKQKTEKSSKRKVKTILNG
jgi:hypothetical protein